MSFKFTTKIKLSIMAAVIVLSLASAYFSLFRKQLKQLSSLQTQLRAMETSFAKIKKDESYVPRLEKEIIDNKQKISLIKKRIPTDLSVAELVQSLAQIGAKLGIKEYTSLVPGEIMALDKYIMVPVRVTFHCEYPQLIEYLKELEKMERLARIDGIRIRTNEQDPEEIIIELPLTAFSLLEQAKK
ncbi:MAG: type 4a pilus biogenesis protein PilO [Elusimicrobia bacterium]|nr:type 4a pilus biogenesis protein PilO [Elusimicrobiota bacterium]